MAEPSTLGDVGGGDGDPRQRPQQACGARVGVAALRLREIPAREAAAEPHAHGLEEHGHQAGEQGRPRAAHRGSASRRRDRRPSCCGSMYPTATRAPGPANERGRPQRGPGWRAGCRGGNPSNPGQPAVALAHCGAVIATGSPLLPAMTLGCCGRRRSCTARSRPRWRDGARGWRSLHPCLLAAPAFGSLHWWAGRLASTLSAHGLGVPDELERRRGAFHGRGSGRPGSYRGSPCRRAGRCRKKGSLSLPAAAGAPP
jgi:hypothetical protein